MTVEVNISAATRWTSIAVIWLIAALSIIAIGVFATPAQYDPWLSLTLGGSAVLALCAQLATQQRTGFVNRLAGTLVGAFAIVGIGAAILWATAR